MMSKPILTALLFILSLSAFSQATITGHVNNQAGEPISGATITLENKANKIKKTVQSSADGSFSISDVKTGDGYKLTLSHIGFEPHTLSSMAVNQEPKTPIMIVMQAASHDIEEVVVVGYSTQKKINLTGSVDQVSGKVLENRSISNTSQGLQGMIPNLNLVMGDGKPIQSPEFNIRGNTSIGQGGAALVLIDGSEGNPALLNPNDIASVTVLKDASSAAIYGARAAFGVVLITTKSPVKNKTNISYSTNFSQKAPVVRPSYVTNGYQFAKIFNEAWSAWNDYSQFPQNVNKTVKFSQEYLKEYQKRDSNSSLPKVDLNPTTGEYVYYGNTDWYDILYKKNTFAMDHNLSLSGSGEKTGYLISARYFGQNGLFRYNSDDYNMYNFRAKGSIQVLPWLKVENNTDFSVMLYHNPLNVGEGGAIWRNIADEGHEMSPLFNPDGNLSYSAAYSVGDFVYGKNGIDIEQSIFRNRGSFIADFLQNTLRLKGDFTIQNFDDNATTKRVPIPYSVKPGVVQYIGTSTNDIAEKRARTQYMASNIYVEYENKFAEKHNIKTLVGFNYEVSTILPLRVSRNGLAYDNAENINLALGTNIVPTEDYERWVVKGRFFRVNYGFDDKYLLEVNGRYDGTSKFPLNSQFGFFPSVSAGWRLSNEKFWNVSKKAISEVKFRASYGSLGNGNIASYQFLEQFHISQSSRILGGTKVPQTSQPNIIPDNLVWEKATTTDIGIDIGLLANRLQINADWYVRKTTNMFTSGPTLPAVYGAAAPRGNYADFKTIGWEIVAAWRNNGRIAHKTFNYGIRLSMADYQAEITRYNNPSQLISDYYVGQKLGSIWGYVTDGLFTAENIDKAKAQNNSLKASNSGTTLPGDIKFLDLNNDGVINTGKNTVADPGDRKIIGNSNPRYSFGALLDIEWNNIFISAFLQGVGQQNWWPGAEADAFWGPYNRPYNRVPLEMVDKIWSEKNPQAYFPRLRGYVALGGRELNVTQTRYLQNVAYLRLKNLQVGYTMPQQLIGKLGMSQAKIYLSAENIWTYSPMYKITHNLDVENIQASDKILTTGGHGNGNNYPIMKGVTLGLNIGF